MPLRFLNLNFEVQGFFLVLLCGVIEFRLEVLESTGVGEFFHHLKLESLDAVEVRRECTLGFVLLELSVNRPGIGGLH